MEMFKIPKMDHSKEAFGDSMGLTDYEQHHARTAVLFETIANNLLAQSLFEDPMEAPADMRTVSGVFQKALAHALTPAEQIYICCEFQHTYMQTRQGMFALEEAAKRKALNKKPEDAKSLKSLLGQIMEKIHSLPLEHTVRAIRKANYDFEKFIALVIPKSEYHSDGSHKEDQKGRTLPGGASLDDAIRKSLGPDVDFRIGRLDEDGNPIFPGEDDGDDD